MRAGMQSRNADFKNCGEAATTTLGPKGRRPFYTTRRRQAATIYAPKARAPSVPAPVIPSSDTNVNHIERRRNNMQDIIDQLAVIRVQLDELEKEIRGMMAQKEEEKPPVTMADVRRLMAEKWNLGKRDEVRSLLAAYGAQKLTDVSPGHYEELAEKIEAL